MTLHLNLAAAAVISAALAIAGCAANPAQPPPVPLAPPPAAGTVTITLIGLNDFHGNLAQPPGTVTLAGPNGSAGERVPAGGIVALACLTDTLRAQNPGRTLIVAAGDMIGASPLVSGLFHDEPSIDALGLLGLDVSSVGNHEFDKGRAELLRMQHGGCFPGSADGRRGVVGRDTCMNDGHFAGARFTYLAANVIDGKSGATLFPATALRTVDGVRIGFIGLTLAATPAVVTPAGVAGLQFTDEVATVNALAPTLRAQGAAAIVVLIHQGGTTRARHVNDQSCPGLNGPIVDIVDAFDAAVDVVISGHTHQEYVCTRSNGMLLTQTGSAGRVATRIELTIDRGSNRVVRKQADNLVAIDSTTARPTANAPANANPAGLAPATEQPTAPAMQLLVQRYERLSAPLAGVVVGTLAGALERRTNAAGESTLGDVIADAYLAATAVVTASHGPAQIAFTNPGGLRTNLDSDLKVTYGQLYSVLPFANDLISMDLSGAQLLRLLEQQWEAPQPPGGRVLSVSQGFSYQWDASMPAGAAAGTGHRVVSGSLRLNGVPVEAQRQYRITVNSFMASGGDNASVLRDGTGREQGPIDVEAASAYFSAQGTVAVPPRDRVLRVVRVQRLP